MEKKEKTRWRGLTCLSLLVKKIKLKIENNVKKVKKVLQNGYKYPQNSSTSRFLIYFINLVHNFIFVKKVSCKIFKSLQILVECLSCLQIGSRVLLEKKCVSHYHDKTSYQKSVQRSRAFVFCKLKLIFKAFIHVQCLSRRRLNSSTLLFSINLIHLNALKFRQSKIVKNFYGAPPPPEFGRSRGRAISVYVRVCKRRRHCIINRS